MVCTRCLNKLKFSHILYKHQDSKKETPQKPQNKIEHQFQVCSIKWDSSKIIINFDQGSEFWCKPQFYNYMLYQIQQTLSWWKK